MEGQSGKSRKKDKREVTGKKEEKRRRYQKYGIIDQS